MNALPESPHRLCTFRAVLRSGVWSVTRDDIFYGDYLARAEALRAACSAARAVEARGGTARVIDGRGEIIVGHQSAGI